MRVAVFVVLATAAGCSSPNVAPRAPAPETVRVVGGSGGAIAMGMNPSAADAHAATVDAPLADVWRVMPAVFESFSIPLSTIDSTTHAIGHSGFNIRRRLGTVPLVRLIDCGTTQGGPSAETYDIRMAVMTQLRSSGAGTIVSTTVEPMGRPVAFSGEYIRCSSTGSLESRIADAVRTRLGK